MTKLVANLLIVFELLIFCVSCDIQKSNLDQKENHLKAPIAGASLKPEKHQTDEAFDHTIIEEKKMERAKKMEQVKIEQEKTQWAQQKIVYLTFDDGPTKYTPQILDILKQNNIKGTFFLVGNYIKGKEVIVKRIKDEGDFIGLHSMTHDEKLLFLSPESYINEYKQEQLLLESLGVQTNLSRTPYGSKPLLTQPYRDQIFNAHLKLWDWTIDSDDWRYENHINLIIDNVSRQIRRQHEVVLLHDHVNTVKALPGIIKLFKDRGYTFQPYQPDIDFMVNFWNDPRL
jgi:peptidoglycan/xylan/chitin deacetylase (PgdA/CDA1 family)